VNDVIAGGHLARLTALVVTTKSRGSGIGKALVREAEAFARANGCKRLELTSGYHRTDARVFYEKLGYQRISQRFVRAL
jgi:GNAT superfamily N-acetyltransferase